MSNSRSESLAGCYRGRPDGGAGLRESWLRLLAAMEGVWRHETHDVPRWEDDGGRAR